MTTRWLGYASFALCAGIVMWCSVAFAGGTGISDTPTAVPEPTTLALLAGGMIGLVAVRRRARRLRQGTTES